jgi:hypothetical protein
MTEADAVVQPKEGQRAVLSGNAAATRRWIVAPFVGFAVSAAHLAWEAMHGGIRSHHLLNQADLPAISNSWGILVLPMLGWMAAYFVRRRATSGAHASSRALAALCGALAVGVALSAAFRMGWGNVTAGLFFAVLLSGVVPRIYRAEYAFGFVLGMTFVFGSVLPTMAAMVAAGVSALAHFAVYPALAALYRRLRARR